MGLLTWLQNNMFGLVAQGSIVVVHDNSVQGLAEYVCGSKSWYSNDTFCSFYSLCHCVLFGSWATKQPWAYSRNGNFILMETESSVSACVPPENTILFLFPFPHKNFHFHFGFANFHFHIYYLFPFCLRKMNLSTPFSSLRSRHVKLATTKQRMSNLFLHGML